MVQKRHEVILAFNLIKNNFDQTLNTIKFSKGKIVVSSKEKRDRTKYSVNYMCVKKFFWQQESIKISAKNYLHAIEYLGKHDNASNKYLQIHLNMVCVKLHRPISHSFVPVLKDFWGGWGEEARKLSKRIHFFNVLFTRIFTLPLKVTFPSKQSFPYFYFEFSVIMQSK